MKFFLLLIFFTKIYAEPFSKNNDIAQENNKIYNKKNHIGPMGIGLSQSYQIGVNKFCIYNTVKGSVKVQLKKNEVECPKTISD